jgi:hypothetical protein
MNIEMMVAGALRCAAGCCLRYREVGQNVRYDAARHENVIAHYESDGDELALQDGLRALGYSGEEIAAHEREPVFRLPHLYV